MINRSLLILRNWFFRFFRLGALVQTAKECKKLKLGFSVVGNSRVAQTIKLVRLGDFLNLKSSLEDALTYLKAWIIGFKLSPIGFPDEIGYSTCLAWRFCMGTSSKTKICSFSFEIKRTSFIGGERSKSKSQLGQVVN